LRDSHVVGLQLGGPHAHPLYPDPLKGFNPPSRDAKDSCCCLRDHSSMTASVRVTSLSVNPLITPEKLIFVCLFKKTISVRRLTSRRLSRIAVLHPFRLAMMAILLVSGSCCTSSTAPCPAVELPISLARASARNKSGVESRHLSILPRSLDAARPARRAPFCRATANRTIAAIAVTPAPENTISGHIQFPLSVAIKAGATLRYLVILA